MSLLTVEQESFRIGVLAARYGVSAEALRQWERRGLMPPARRSPGGHRLYGPEHVRALDAVIVPCNRSPMVEDAVRAEVEASFEG